MKRIGVLALQGAVAEHLNMLEKLPDVQGRAVRTLEEIRQMDGLILPGGESTAIGRLLDDFNMTTILKSFINDGLPVWGTCAGLILLAKKISGQEKTYLASMNIMVKRNAYGSQIDSFMTETIISSVSKEKLPLVFIRAPYIEKTGVNVDILAEVKGDIVAAREKNMLVTSFHPELTDNLRLHQYFVEKFV
jgi:pyridoxal 5'-phosphate synthase pdxT subunit